MIPILFAPYVDVGYVDEGSSSEYPEYWARSWTKTLLGYLPDCITCTHTEERNGSYELEMTYPDTGTNANLIAVNCIVQVKGANPFENEADFPMFRIYKVERSLSGIVSVRARHISEWISHIVVIGKYISDPTFHWYFDGKVTHPTEVWRYLNYFRNRFFAQDEGLPLGFKAPTIEPLTDPTVYTLRSPSSVRSYLGGGELQEPDRSFLQVWGGEYKYTGWTIELMASRGVQHGLEIRYGLNITGINIDDDVDGVNTVVVPYFQTETDFVLGRTAASPYSAAFPYDRDIAIDFTQEFATDNEGGYRRPTATQLQTAAAAYIARNDIGNPVRMVDIDIALLEQTKEWEKYHAVADLQLCDTVRLVYDRNGLNLTANMKVVELTYDVLRERTTNVKIGTIQRTMVRELAQNTLYRQFRQTT